jgi:hypothetical protein
MVGFLSTFIVPRHPLTSSAFNRSHQRTSSSTTPTINISCPLDLLLISNNVDENNHRGGLTLT